MPTTKLGSLSLQRVDLSAESADPVLLENIYGFPGLVYSHDDGLAAFPAASPPDSLTAQGDRCTLWLYNLLKDVKHMATVTTYTNARAIFAKLCDEVASTREPVIIRRRGAEDVALVSAEELASLIETAHLLRSPKNAERLLNALARAQTEEMKPSSVEDLRRELSLG